MAEEDFGRSIPFAFLEDIKNRFRATYGNRGSTAPPLGMNADFARVLQNQMVSHLLFSSFPFTRTMHNKKPTASVRLTRFNSHTSSSCCRTTTPNRRMLTKSRTSRERLRFISISLMSSCNKKRVDLSIAFQEVKNVMVENIENVLKRGILLTNKLLLKKKHRIRFY